MGQLYEITPFSLLDYPNEMSCIAWFAGCNMRCVYCHNPQIVKGKGEKEDEELISFLEKRKGKLTAVVFSGGEATLYRNLVDLIDKVKSMGFKTKLDTNGSNPKMLKELIDRDLLNYVAMDYKCPPEISKELIGTSKLWEPFRKSLDFMIKAQKEKDDLIFEIRTTVYADYMGEKELNMMIEDLDNIGYNGIYYIQKVFASGENTIGNIAEPKKEIDRSKLLKPKGFKINYRNFDE